MTLSIAISYSLLYTLNPMKPKDQQKHKEWLVYILRCSDGSFYTGITNDLKKRLMGHNRGTASKYTRSRRPVMLSATSCEMDKSDALRLEIKIKKLPKAKKIDALKSGFPVNKHSV